jgi:hypothetical protein
MAGPPFQKGNRASVGLGRGAMKARRARAFAALERELIALDDGRPLSVYERTQLELCVVLHDKAARGRLNDRNSERAGSTSHRILTALRDERRNADRDRPRLTPDAARAVAAILNGGAAR